MPLRNSVLLLCLCALALVSCSDQRGPPDDAAQETTSDVQPTADPAVVAVTAGPTRGGDGSQIALQPLSVEQLGGVELPGELACSFADADDATLLLARADVVPDGMVRAVVNHNGYVELLGNGRAGGYNDLSDGITLTGKGLTVELQRGESRPTGNETTLHAATLKVQRADGAELSYDGTLTCGP